MKNNLRVNRSPRTSLVHGVAQGNVSAKNNISMQHQGQAVAYRPAMPIGRSGNFGLTGAITIVLLWALLLMGIIALAKWTFAGTSQKTAQEVTKEK